MEPISDSPQAFPLPCCRYTNLSGQLVILRCVGPDRFFHEKVIFPFEDWLFACPNNGDVQIWTHGIGGAELLESFLAKELVVEEVEPIAAHPLDLAFAS
jgi:hypothetical protein